jgi:hypothetical protein
MDVGKFNFIYYIQYYVCSFLVYLMTPYHCRGDTALNDNIIMNDDMEGTDRGLFQGTVIAFA